MSKYYYINIRAKQNALVNKYIDEFPILNYIFKNIYVFEVLIILLGLFSNFLILASFNTFTSKGENICGKMFKNYLFARTDERL